MQPEDTICYCFHVTQRKIVNYIRVHQPRRASQISGCGGAGTGCGWCIPYLQRYFAQATGDAIAGDTADAEVLSPDEYERQRAAYIKAGKGTPAAGAIPLPDAPDASDSP